MGVGWLSQSAIHRRLGERIKPRCSHRLAIVSASCGAMTSLRTMRPFASYHRISGTKSGSIRSSERCSLREGHESASRTGASTRAREPSRTRSPIGCAQTPWHQGTFCGTRSPMAPAPIQCACGTRSSRSVSGTRSTHRWRYPSACCGVLCGIRTRTTPRTIGPLGGFAAIARHTTTTNTSTNTDSKRERATISKLAQATPATPATRAATTTKQQQEEIEWRQAATSLTRGTFSSLLRETAKVRNQNPLFTSKREVLSLLGDAGCCVFLWPPVARA